MQKLEFTQPRSNLKVQIGMQGILPIPLNLAKSRDSNFRSLLGKFWLAYVWHLTYLAQLTYTVDNVCVEIL